MLCTRALLTCSNASAPIEIDYACEVVSASAGATEPSTAGFPVIHEERTMAERKTRAMRSLHCAGVGGGRAEGRGSYGGAGWR